VQASSLEGWRGWAGSVARIGTLPTDSHDEALRKQTLVLFVIRTAEPYGIAGVLRVSLEVGAQFEDPSSGEIEGISFTGIITGYKPTYFTSFRTGYEFTLSPHFQVQGGDTRRGRILAPKVADPGLYLLQVDAIIDAALDVHAAAPKPYVASDLVATTFASLSDWQNRADTINAVIDTRVLSTGDDGPNSVARVAQSFAAMGASAAALLPSYAAVSTSTDLAYDSAVVNLQFEVWKREMAFQARQLVVACFNATRDLGTLVDPQAKAIYRPRAGESLYGISNRFYGTPHRWRDIATRNRLQGFTLGGTEVLVIPNVAGKVAGA